MATTTTTWPPTDTTGKEWPSALSTTNPTQWDSSIVPPAARKLGDANYRWYNCNIQCPKMKCDQLDVTTVNLASLGANGVSSHAGYKSSSTSHVFTSTDIPSLSLSCMSGELTMYMTNCAANVSNITLSGFTRANGGFPSGGSIIYQRIGNATNVEMTTNDTSDTVTITVDPAMDCRWIFRGV